MINLFPDIKNPFDAPVYYLETVTSTMDISKELAKEGAPHGTVIAADYQEKGRGRGLQRTWEMDKSAGLPFTVLLRYPGIGDIPSALTLRVGLAISLAIEEFKSSLKGSVMIKWPNDIMINEKKAAGLLCETDGRNVYIGIGVNITQKEFPLHLKEKATSISICAKRDITQDEKFILLEKILIQLFNEFDKLNEIKPRLEERLFKKGENILFMEGRADCGKEVKGTLAGITESGELLILPHGENELRSFITGELSFT